MGNLTKNIDDRGIITPRARPANYEQKKRKLRIEINVLTRFIDTLIDIGDDSLAMSINIILENRKRDLMSLKDEFPEVIPGSVAELPW